MIQRIQTVYLLLAIIAFGLTQYIPMMSFKLVDGSIYKVVLAKSFEHQSVVIASVAAAVSLLITLVTIFLYKKRSVQLSLCRVAMAAPLVGIAPMLYKVATGSFVENAKILSLTGLLVPFVGVIFLFLAIKAIKADENLIRSLNRIR